MKNEDDRMIEINVQSDVEDFNHYCSSYNDTHNNNKKKYTNMIKILMTIIIILITIISTRVYDKFDNRPTLDVVYSYYNEDLKEFIHFSNVVYSSLKFKFKINTKVYIKHDIDENLYNFFKYTAKVDQIEYLTNVGREGHTYLHHIVNNYNSSSLSDKTLFLQAHPGWPKMTFRRLTYVNTATGFISFGPYTPSHCGHTTNFEFLQMNNIWKIFKGFDCPHGDVQTASWSGQFLVSKDRILENDKNAYVEMLNLISAPSDHPIYDETPSWWYPKNDPANPYIGHSLERSWPIIFNCNDLQLSDENACAGDQYATKNCQCFD